MSRAAIAVTCATAADAELIRERLTRFFPACRVIVSTDARGRTLFKIFCMGMLTRDAILEHLICVEANARISFDIRSRQNASPQP
jgi:hypothetical protein